MPEEIARGPDAEAPELLRPALTDALEKLDGHVQAQSARLP
jgi:hypothetical protein